ncbi:MAG: HPF/RaiA family ribosome-associated protein [Minisyncoccia bacterium]
MISFKISALKTNLLSSDKEFFEKKLKEIEKYTRFFKRNLQLEVVVEKVSNSQTGEIYSAEARLYIPGNDISAKVTASDIKELAVLLKDNLKRLIIEHRKTRESFFRRTARKFKEKIIWRYLKH